MAETTRILGGAGMAEAFQRCAERHRSRRDWLAELPKHWPCPLTAEEREALDHEINVLTDAAEFNRQQAEWHAAKGEEGRRGGGRRDDEAGSPVLARRDAAIQRQLHGIVVQALEADEGDPAERVTDALASVCEVMTAEARRDLLVTVRGALGGRLRSHDTRARAVVDGIRDGLDANKWGVARLTATSPRRWRRILGD